MSKPCIAPKLKINILVLYFRLKFFFTMLKQCIKRFNARSREVLKLQNAQENRVNDQVWKLAQAKNIKVVVGHFVDNVEM